VNEKQQLIAEMLEMQKQFSAYAKDHGLTPEELWAGEEGHPLEGYRERFWEKAERVIELAHEQRQSKP